MKFAVIAEYTSDKARIAEVRPLHRAHLMKLKEQKKIVVSGPFGDDSGALMIFEAENAEEIEHLLSIDPFMQGGVITKREIRPWRDVYTDRGKIPA
jgi:uncharacterized protein YciI